MVKRYPEKWTIYNAIFFSTKRFGLIFLYILLIFFCLADTVFAVPDINNPAPLPDDLVLPMPNGRIMVFRHVCMGEGSGMYAWKRFRVGDPSGGYKESPAEVALGGAFRVNIDNNSDWCFYMGKYEVTEDQYQAVIQTKSGMKKKAYPVANISWFDAENFTNKYNQWLFKNKLESLPVYGSVPGYLRLPTEFEWEFAARGGSKVDGAVFDRKTPYPARRLADYEWFSGPKSSHNKVKKVGLLKPNPLGIHDMLGNVAEMTRTLYRIEYYQGRSGGFVARGGHYLTDGKRLRSSLRSEQEFYNFDQHKKRLAPGKKATLGFRLVLSSLIFPNRKVSNQMKMAWEQYRNGLGSTLPAAVSTGSVSAKTKVSGNDASTYLRRLKAALDQSGTVSPEVNQALKNLGASLEQIQFTIQQAERDSAYAWIKIAAEQAFFITREARKLPILHQLQTSARQSGRQSIMKKYVAREREIQTNINQAMSSYTESIRQLGASGGEAFKGSFKRYREFLKQRNAVQQLGLLPVVERHASSYLDSKRTNDQQWKKELLEWQSS